MRLGQVSDEILKQTQEILEFAAQKIGKEDKEMAVTFVTNERSHELNLEYRDTDRPTDVISLEYKPEMEISFDEEDLAENPELAEMMAEFDTYIGELFISIDKAREQAEEYGHSFEREMGFLVVHGFLHINGYDHYTPGGRKGNVWLTGRDFDSLWTHKTISENGKSGLHFKPGVCDNRNFTSIKEERTCASMPYQALAAILAGLVFRISATEWLFYCSVSPW